MKGNDARWRNNRFLTAANWAARLAREKSRPPGLRDEKRIAKLEKKLRGY